MTKRKSADTQSITGESGHRYFHMMLNIADDELSPHEYRLLGHYLRWAGHGGAYEEGIRQTAKVCQMAQKTVQKIRDSLVKKGYIKVELPTSEQLKEGIPTKITVIDRWADNIERYVKTEAPPVVNGKQGNTVDTFIKTESPPVVNGKHIEEHTIEDIEESSAPKAARAANPFYDAIHEVWQFIGSRNGSYQKMLQGKATDPTHKPGNVEPPMTPDEILRFGRWYKSTHDQMVVSPTKVQSAVAQYRALRLKRTPRPPEPDMLLNLPDDFDPRNNPDHHELMIAELQRVNGMIP